MISFPFSLPPRYKFAGERLEGGQGYVYICTDTYLERKVAIKVMASSLDTETLKAELASMRDVRSPHVAEIYDLIFAKRSGTAGLIQEYVPGDSLDAYAMQDHDRVDIQRTLWQLSKGLTDIHCHGKLHRDIKPPNARFDSEHVLKILDFGIASAIDPEAYTVNARGTRGFLGPEFYDPPPIKLTTAVDVYAFGVTAWCIATKLKLPLELAELPPQRTGRVASLSTIWTDWPNDLIAMIDSCLAPDPNGRPTMKEVTRVLESHLLYGKHRATFFYKGRAAELGTAGKTIKLQSGSDSVVIGYDGLAFSIRSIDGNVYVNNRDAVLGAILPGSCVFTLGGPWLRYQRTFVTMDVSHPEVVL